MNPPRIRPVEVLPAGTAGRGVLGLPRTSDREGYVLRDPSGLSEHSVLVSDDMLFVVQRLDGRNSLLDIQADWMRARGAFLFRENLEELLRALDDALLLDNDRFRKHLETVEAGFRNAPTRPAAFAGKAYDADPSRLRGFLSDTLERTPGSVPAVGGPPAGLIAPHIDLAAGAPVYGAAYRSMLDLGRIETFVVLGTAHAGSEPLALTRKDFETPLGTAPNDRVMADRLLGEASADLLSDELVHRTEHSIEFQVLWLQHVANRPFKILPLLCGPFPEGEVSGFSSPCAHPGIAAAVETLRRMVAEGAGRVAVVAGADFAHIGPRYGDAAPVTQRDLDITRTEDGSLLDRVERVDAEGFYRAVTADGNRRRVCGVNPIYVLLKLLEGGCGERLGYDIWVDRQTGSAVSFAAAAIYLT